ncbi:MAG: Wzz/FepE/Etk N-terminal domain-containing protein [Verrucomicrobiota bacterium]
MSLTPYTPSPPDLAAPRGEGHSDPEFIVDPLLDRHDLAHLLKRNWKVIAVVPLLCAILSTLWKVTREPVYESSAMLLVDSSLDQLLQFENVGSSKDSVQDSLRSLEVAVVADSVVLRVVERLDLRDSNGFLPADMAAIPELPDAKLLNFIQNNRISASLQPETRIIKITATDPDPERAKLVASTFVEEFQSFLADQRRGEVSKVKELIEIQVAEAKAEALKAERDLKTIREENKGAPLDQDHDLFAARLSQFGADLNEAVRSRVELEGIHESLSKLPENTPAADVIEIAGYRSDSHFSGLMTSLANANSRLAAAQQQFTPSHPTYLAAAAEATRYKEEIESFARDITETIAARYEAARKREALLDLEVSQLQNQLIDQKSRGSEFRVAMEEVDTRWLHYKTLQQRLSENIISTEMPGSIATVVSEPLTPFRAAGPPTFIFTAAGGFVGLFLIAGFLCWKILKGIPFTDAQQLENRFRLPVIADWTDQAANREGTNAMMPYLLGGQAQIMQVSAPGLPGECQAVAQKLALSLANGNRRTLLVRVKGHADTARITESGTKNLSLLTLSPDDIFDPSRFSSVLPKLRGSFEKILIEAGTLQSPPLIEWISSFSDREVMAVAKGTSAKSEVEQRVRRLNRESDTRIGFIFVESSQKGIQRDHLQKAAATLLGASERRGIFPRFALKH